MKYKNSNVALVTGVNRGIGSEVCKKLVKLGHTIIFCSRDLVKGKNSANSLIEENIEVRAVILDVTNLITIQTIKIKLCEEFQKLDVLINNVVILYDSWKNTLQVDFNTVRQAFETNTIDIWQTIQESHPLLLKSVYPRVVNRSSRTDQISDISAGLDGWQQTINQLDYL